MTLKRINKVDGLHYSIVEAILMQQWLLLLLAVT